MVLHVVVCMDISMGLNFIHKFMHLATCDNLTTFGLLSYMYMLLSAVLKAVIACIS